MNEPFEADVWTRKKWCGAVLAIFALQVGLILLLSDRGPVSAREVPKSNLRLVPQLASDARFASVLQLHDPAAFALANRHGFSGRSWLRDIPPEHEMLDWLEPETWLTNQTEQLGQTFVAYSRSQTLPVTTLARATAPPEDFAIRAESFLPTRSEWRVPSGWSLLDAPQPPSWTNATVLNRTRVTVSVDARGEVLSAVVAAPLADENLTDSSGSPEADKKALELARGLRLGRTSKLGDVNWLTLDLVWHTLPVGPKP